MKKAKILFISGGDHRNRLLVDREIRAVFDALRQSPKRDAIEAHVQWAARPADLQAALLMHTPDIVHFLGHGSSSGEGRLLFEGDSGQLVGLPQQPLKQLFAVAAPSVRIVVLSACVSASYAEDIARSVGCVVSTGETTDLDDLHFTVGFYRALAFGQSLRSAFEIGRNQVALYAALDAVGRPYLNHGHQLFVGNGVDPDRQFLLIGEESDSLRHSVAAPQLEQVGISAPAPGRLVGEVANRFWNWLTRRALDAPGDSGAPQKADVHASAVANELELSVESSERDVVQFFRNAGFTVRRANESAGFYCTPRFDTLKVQLDGDVYACVVTGKSPDADDILKLRDAAKRAGPSITNGLFIIDRPLGEPAWLQLATLRATRFNIIPIPYSAILESLTAPRPDAAQVVLAKHLERFLNQRADPYNARHPVYDVLSFFGRDALAGEMVDRIESDQSIGLFGLRKMGKSSLLHFVRGRLQHPAAMVDLQATGTLAQIYDRILYGWHDDAATRLRLDLGLSKEHVGRDDPDGDFTRLTRNALATLTRTVSAARLTLLLDEIEMLMPPASGGSTGTYLRFSRTLRALMHETKSLSVVVAGVDPAVVQLNRWESTGEQNPFYALLHEIYMPPLLEADCIQMVRNIGQQVGLSFTDEAAAFVARASGGHPMLARQLCSLTYRRRKVGGGTIKLEELEAAAETFLYDPSYASTLEKGLWGEVTGGPLWRADAASAHETILQQIASADASVHEVALLDQRTDVIYRKALASLSKLSVIRRASDAPMVAYEISYGLLRAWIRRTLLGMGK